MNPKITAISHMLDQAKVYLTDGQTTSAQIILEEVLKKQPRNTDALQLIGISFAIEKKFKNAIDFLSKALKTSPGNPRVLFNRGNAYSESGMHKEAVADLERTVAIQPTHLEALVALGNSFKELEQFDKAAARYEQALRLDPNCYKALVNKGGLLIEEKRFPEALEVLGTAIAVAPEMPEAHSNRGTALIELGRLEMAIQSCDNAISVQPDYAKAHYGRGIALSQLNLLQDALASTDRAIALKPDFAESHYSRGVILSGMRRLDEAAQSYETSIAIRPDYADPHLARSINALLTGQFVDGWRLYEWRMKMPEIKSHHPTFNEKISWRGTEDIRNKKLLVYAEQGFGDTLQFCRYLPQLRAMGAEISFEIPAALNSVLATLNCPLTLVTQGDPRGEFDAYCPLMSLPLAFKTTVETVPAPTRYLSSDQGKVSNWGNILGKKVLPRIGLVWTGSKAHKNDINRSIALSKILRLTDLPVEWHSLQKDYRPGDDEVLAQHPEIHQHQEALEDFSDTAALIECMDLVISVDTSVAHLAGALGKKLWVMLPFVPDFRWMLDRTDSPWYPTARLFRQPQPGDWDSVIAEIRSAL